MKTWKTMPLLIFLVVGGCLMLKGSERGSEDKERQAIVTFFDNYLNGKAKEFDVQRKFKVGDLEAARAKVWQAWRDANTHFQEQKLPALRSLDDVFPARWTIPAELEPNAIMPFYWGSKGEQKPEAGYPLFIYTHGSGPKAMEWAAGLKWCRVFEDAPSVYFIPQIPNEGEYYRWWQRSKQFAWERLLRLALVSGEIDANRIYILGISEGGYGSQRLASFYADYLAGAGPMAGGEPLKNAPAENCRHIAFSLRTGAADNGFYRNRLTGYVKEAFDSLQRQYPGDYVHQVELIPGQGHAIDYRPTTPWLKTHARNPYPKTVNWENFEMDGRYRDGFYNIHVIERSNPDDKSRTYYQMNIEDNCIHLDVQLVTYKAVEIDPYWGIELKFERSYQPATRGKLVLYLNEQLVDLNREVTLIVNGKEIFRGKLKCTLANLVNSCATFYDPARLYPAAIEVDLSQIQ